MVTTALRYLPSHWLQIVSAFKHLFPSLHTCFYLPCFPLSFPLLTEALLILTSLIVNSGATSCLHALVTGALIQGLSFFVNTCGACRKLYSRVLAICKFSPKRFLWFLSLGRQGTHSGNIYWINGGCGEEKLLFCKVICKLHQVGFFHMVWAKKKKKTWAKMITLAWFLYEITF